MAPGKPLLEHRLTAFARLQGGGLAYTAGLQDERAQQRLQQAGAGQRAIDGFFKPGGSKAQPQAGAAGGRDGVATEARQAEAGGEQQAQQQQQQQHHHHHQQQTQARHHAQQQQGQAQHHTQQQGLQQQLQQPAAPAAGGGSRVGKPGDGQQRLDGFFRKQSQEERQRALAHEEEARHWQLEQRAATKPAAGIAAYFRPQAKRSRSEG